MTSPALLLTFGDGGRALLSNVYTRSSETFADQNIMRYILEDGIIIGNRLENLRFLQRKITVQVHSKAYQLYASEYAITCVGSITKKNI
jgi:hypothetical protein